jgi:hypothetical protein
MTQAQTRLFVQCLRAERDFWRAPRKRQFLRFVELKTGAQKQTARALEMRNLVEIRTFRNKLYAALVGPDDGLR